VNIKGWDGAKLRLADHRIEPSDLLRVEAQPRRGAVALLARFDRFPGNLEEEWQDLACLISDNPTIRRAVPRQCAMKGVMIAWHRVYLAADKNDLIRLLTTANDDLRRLRDEASASGMSRTADAGDQNTAWNAHLEGQALNAGIPKEAISISGEKPGTQGEQTKEALIDISLKKVNVRHLAKFAASLESGTKPIKIRSMVVDAKPDGSAWLDATLSISAFAMKNQ
jgi:hypothetical protein